MSKLRIAGGILVGFGTVLGGVAALALAGIIPLSIDFFGFNLDTRGERIVWIIVWSFTVAVGVVLLRVRREEPRD
jgi:predicted cobalt transporter CbtA